MIIRHTHGPTYSCFDEGLKVYRLSDMHVLPQQSYWYETYVKPRKYYSMLIPEEFC